MGPGQAPSLQHWRLVGGDDGGSKRLSCPNPALYRAHPTLNWADCAEDTDVPPAGPERTVSHKSGTAHPPLEEVMRSMLTAMDHREARRLLWKSRHVPVLTIFASSWVVAGVLSAVLSILAQGPANPIP